MKPLAILLLVAVLALLTCVAMTEHAPQAEIPLATAYSPKVQAPICTAPWARTLNQPKRSIA